jgi:ribosomal-protein-alanine N-acetyltransferase
MTAAREVVVRTLRATDAAALLAFELENRAWFERHIEPRDPAFYSPAGVAAHVDDYLAGLAAGTWHPFVLVAADGAIVGRANLKAIDQAARSAEVGYRVAEQACGRGLATLALRHLAREASARWRLQRLDAFVYPANAGSHRVLGRCGFVAQPLVAGEAEQRFSLALSTT